MTTLRGWLRDPNHCKKEIRDIVNQISMCGRAIAHRLRRMPIDLSDPVHPVQTNVHGEQVKALDAWANDLLVSQLKKIKSIGALISEEEEYAIKVNPATGKYLVCFDPLDGSSNLEAQVNVGTIFAIYPLNQIPTGSPKSQAGGQAGQAGHASHAGSLKRGTSVLSLGRHSGIMMSAQLSVSINESLLDNDGYLRPGKDIICAGYLLYGASTMLVLSMNNIPSRYLADVSGSGSSGRAGGVVHGFCLDEEIGRLS